MHGPAVELTAGGGLRRFSCAAAATPKARRSLRWDGAITIRDQANQQQNVADLSRDVENANDAISPIFKKEKEQNRLQTVQLMGEIGSQVSDIVKTQGELNALQKAKDKYGELPANATEEKRQQWLDQLKNSPEYKDELAKSGTGSDLQRGIQAATAALTGLAGGNMNAALAGAAAPYLAEQVKKQVGEDNIAANAIAHAIVGGVVAELSGGNGLAGAAGAASGGLAARALMAEMYPGKTASQLSEEEKQKISALATLAAGLAGGLAGDNTASALAGAQTGKNAVENNSLAGDKGRESLKESAEWWKEQIRDKLGENTASQLANGLVNLASETGDLAMLGGDTAFDLIAALATCATGDSYCSQAKSDIAKKDAAAAKVLDGIINGDAWEGIKSTAIKAANGDQKALENVAGVISGAFIPAKILPGGKSTNTASTGKGTATNVADDVAGMAGSRHPLLDDALSRNGDRTVVNQGALPTCGHNSCGMVLDTMGKPVDIVSLISNTPLHQEA